MTLLTPPHTPADLLNPPDEKLYELIDGELVEKPVSVRSIWIATQICFNIELYLRREPIGYVLVEQTVVCFPGPPQSRPPARRLLRQSCPPARALPDGNLEVAPELAVEVASPNDNVFEFETKLAEYFSCGVRTVWVVLPEQKSVRVEHADGTARRLGLADTLDGGDVLPGFACPVADLFPKA